MGLSGISVFQIVVILLIVLLVFGTKRIRNIGSDLGAAVRDFRKGVSDDEDEDSGQDSAGSEGENSSGPGPDSQRKP